MNRTSALSGRLLGAVLTLAAWELAAIASGTNGSIPSPGAVLASIYSSRSEYAPHILATLRNSAVGLLLGVAIGGAIATGVALMPTLGVLLAPCTFVFSIPLIILVPIIGMTSSPEVTPAICSFLLVYYPILLLTNVGLGNAPHTLLSYADSAGSDRWKVFRYIRIRSALPGFAAGLQAAVPVAVLGSMLGELTGARWGLGSYLLAIMAQASPSREWGVFLVTALIAAGASWFSAAIWRRCGIDATSVESFPRGSGTRWQTPIGLLLGLLLWEAVSRYLANPYFVKGPVDIFKYLSSPRIGGGGFFAAFTETLGLSGLGLCLGLAAGCALALVLVLLPVLEAPMLSIAFVTQAVPIVALVPLYLSVFGRGLATTMAITISATFFLSFASIYQGLRRTPASMLNFASSTGAPALLVLWRIRLPAAIPFFFAAARLTAPRVLLGVTLAEYLATRRGVGAMLFEARGKLDFGLMWTIAVIAGAISMIAAELIQHWERRASSRFS